MITGFTAPPHRAGRLSGDLNLLNSYTMPSRLAFIFFPTTGWVTNQTQGDASVLAEMAAASRCASGRILRLPGATGHTGASWKRGAWLPSHRKGPAVCAVEAQPAAP